MKRSFDEIAAETEPSDEAAVAESKQKEALRIAKLSLTQARKAAISSLAKVTKCHAKVRRLFEAQRRSSGGEELKEEDPFDHQSHEDLLRHVATLFQEDALFGSLCATSNSSSSQLIQELSVREEQQSEKQATTEEQAQSTVDQDLHNVLTAPDSETDEPSTSVPPTIIPMDQLLQASQMALATMLQQEQEAHQKYRVLATTWQSKYTVTKQLLRKVGDSRHYYRQKLELNREKMRELTEKVENYEREKQMCKFICPSHLLGLHTSINIYASRNRMEKAKSSLVQSEQQGSVSANEQEPALQSVQSVAAVLPSVTIPTAASLSLTLWGQSLTPILQSYLPSPGTSAPTSSVVPAVGRLSQHSQAVLHDLTQLVCEYFTVLSLPAVRPGTSTKRTRHVRELYQQTRAVQALVQVLQHALAATQPAKEEEAEAVDALLQSVLSNEESAPATSAPSHHESTGTTQQSAIFYQPIPDPPRALVTHVPSYLYQYHPQGQSLLSAIAAPRHPVMTQTAQTRTQTTVDLAWAALPQTQSFAHAHQPLLRPVSASTGQEMLPPRAPNAQDLQRVPR